MTNHKFFATVLMLAFLMSGAVFADTWTTYNTSNTPAIGNNTINNVDSDSSNVRWIGNNGGLAKYDGTTWTKYGTGQGLGSNTVNHVSFDTSSNKWVATAGGTAKYNGTSWTKYTTANSGIASNNCLTVAAEGTVIWIGTYANGVSKYDGTTWTTYNTTNSGLASIRVYDAAVDGSGNKWFATLNGVSKYDGTTWTNYTSGNCPLANNSVKSVVIAPNGDKWFGTLGGANRFNGSSWTTYTQTQGLAKNDTLAVEAAPDGTIWVGSNGSGATKYNSSSWTVYNSSNSGLGNNTVYSVDCESNTITWFGTGGGASLFDTTVYPPAANFTGTPTSGNSPLTVNFTDTSTGSPTAWSWTFGDSGTSTAQNPSHQYTSAGTYTVALTASNAGGSNTNTKTNYITVTSGPPAPVANFTGSPTSGVKPLTVNFTDSSTNTPTSWSWTFGDSGTSTAQNPSHQYQNAGTYTVSLTATNAGGSDIETKTNYITVTNPPLNAAFTSDKTSGSAPLTVTFTDTSTGNICTWKWRFDPNDPNSEWNNSSYGNPPPWTYNNPGSYTVRLEVVECSTGARDTETKVNYITVTTPTPPTAAFTGSPLSGNYPLTVNFTDSSTGSVSSWSWVFGDAGTSTVQNPSHQYTAEGAYTVGLTVTGPVGSSVKTEPNYVIVTAPPPVDAQFSATPTSGAAPLSVNFTDQSTGTVTGWSWTFGDGGTSTSENPGHNYTAAGVYDVSLTATGPLGSDSLTRASYITVSPCTAAFTGSPTSGAYPLTVNFTDSSSGSITSRSWTFGDGGTSTATNPSHQYQYAGAFTVSLTVSGSYGSDIEAKTNYINVSAPATPVAAFTGSPTDDLHPLTVNFTDQSTGTITAWSWVFGDGGTSTTQNPSHQYVNPGAYTVSLTVSGPSGSDIETKSNYITALEHLYTETWATYNTSNTPAIGNNTINGVASTGGTGWFATNGGGIARFTGTSWTKFTTTQGLANNTVYAVAFDSSSNTWVATNGGVNKYTGSSWTKYTTANSALAGNATRAIVVDNSSDVWVGTLSNGLCRFTGTSWTTFTTANSGLPDNAVKGIVVDSSNSKWVATMTGVAKYDGTTWAKWSKPPLLSDDVYAIAMAPNSDKWVGTLKEAARFNGTSWTSYTVANGLAKDDNHAVAVDSDGVVWAGSTGSGISKFTGTSWSKYNTTNSGLANNTVNAAAIDGLTRWFGTNGGVSKLQFGVINPNLPDADFSGSPTSGTTDLAVVFSDLSTGNPTSWNWTFGDGQTSIEQNPAHTYVDAGTYSVSLTIANSYGSDTLTRTNYITASLPHPVPDFEASPTDGIYPLRVDFTDKSTGGCIDTWKYDFDGNGTYDSSDSSNGNEYWTYNTIGVYTVVLRIRECGTGLYYNKTRSNLINVRGPIAPDANFVASKTVGGFAPQRIDFTDKSTGDGLNAWSWTFGDSGTSTAQNPTHIYQNGGTYTVSMAVSSSYGSSDTLTRTNYIVVGPLTACDANFVGSPASGFSPLKVQFTDTTYGSVTSWSWTFGDGQTSTDMNPLYSYGIPGTYTVALTATGPLNSDSKTRANYILVQIPPAGGSGFSVADSPLDLSNQHPHLVMKGYGTENGLWAKAQTTHSEIWARLTSTAPTGATFPGISRNMTSQQSVMAYLISKINGYGQFCQDMVHSCMNYNWIVGGDDEGIASMETFWGYCMAYDATVDDPQHGGPTWLSPSDKSTVLANIAEFVQELNFETGDTWRLRPTHNFMVCRAGDHAAGLYNLRGEPGYENVFNVSRQYDLIYHNERVNGLCDHGVLGTTAPLSNSGPRPADGFPYEGPSYGAYQGSRALVHRYIMELNEYPNPDTVLDENKQGFTQNFVLAWMAVAPPGLDTWADVAYNGDHGVVQAMRYHSAINKAVGVSDTCIIPPGKMARVAEWFTRTLIPLPKGSPDSWWWQGFEYIWYDASIEPMTPAEAGLPPYIHLNDAEFHMYRSDWNMSNWDGTYVYTRNGGHEGHYYWSEKHSGSDVPPNCQVQTTSHDGADNGHFGIYRAGEWIAFNKQPQGNTDAHNCLLIDGLGGAMDDQRGYQAYALATTDCIGAVDSDYGHALDEVMGGIYSTITSGNDGYHRYMLVLRDPMYVLIADELESGHTANFIFHTELPITKVSESLYTSNMSRNELLYPASGFTATGLSDISITTTSPQLLWMTHANPSGVTFNKSYPGNLCVATIGADTVVYNPTGGNYTQGSISGNAKIFAQRTGNALIVKATSATGAQYGVSCTAAVNMSVKGRKASIYVYGTGSQTVTVTSPYGTDAFANVPAGQTIAKVLTGLGVAPPVADFMAIPTSGWNTYIAPEFVSYSSGWITDYLWEYGDGEWSTEVAPHHKYATAGIYTIKLTVAGPGGSSSATKANYITINDFGNYNWPDYILTSPSTAWTAFTSALTSIEASQTEFYTQKPEWCHNGSWTPWCDVVTSLCGHGGGGRILFNFSNTTVYGNWDDRIDPIKTWGDSNGKYDWVGDNLIVDGEDKNINIYYNGAQGCSQLENKSALRIHGVDNIVRNIGWTAFPDGIHGRHGMRILLEGITNMVVCEDTMTFNGVGGACMYCTSRNNTFGASNDKTQMYLTADGWRQQGPASAVICGMHSTDASQSIRMTSSEGGRKAILVVRNSWFGGSAQGPRFGGKMDDNPPNGLSGAFCIFENNYSTTTKGGSCGGMRIGEGIHMIVRNNILENSNSYGVYTYSDGASVRFEHNIFRNNAEGGVITGSNDTAENINYDLGGGLVDVWEIDPAGTFYGASAAARAAVPSCGQNTFQGNGVADLINNIAVSPQPVVKAENNFWDHSDVASVLANDVSGNVDVDPLGVDLSQ